MVSTNLKLQHTRYGPSYSLCCKVVEMSFCNPFSPSSVSFQPNLLFLPQDLYKFSSPFSSSSCSCSSSCTTTATTTNTTRRAFSLLTATSSLIFSPSFTRSSDASAVSDFFELENSGGVKALDLREGEGEVPVIGDQVISGIEAAVKSMKVGGIRRVIIPPSQGYQNTSQEPIPPNFFDRQRLFTTIFNPTRLANGEGSTLGTLIFDIELVSVRHPNVLP
ncbi:peptidyl-prolyl cis-trans isomerase FKBP17-1, chloroplastic-like isoform X3 [Magnolia sinica]|uniref:peptidyl-prolyl cis-trans isomerase FKBP17-1, chloroplastic-like isoform X3 n=1 Tax=Magnolia sinica TaxID=86752 RepID=UPI0026583B41|nr:peptidyl-prolyl cis-trans isomerase FKBP17-1, chloroplastic-like isoform X3 [Magnolia sinica]